MAIPPFLAFDAGTKRAPAAARNQLAADLGDLTQVEGNAVAALAGTQLVTPGSKSSNAIGMRTKRSAYTWGTAGSYSATPANMSNLGLRRTLRLPVTTTRWRIKVANYDFMRNVAGTAGTLAIGSDVFVGQALQDTAQGGGKYASTPVSALTNPGAPIPADGSSWTSDWVTDSSKQMLADTMMMISFDATGSTTAAFQSNTRGFHTFGVGVAGQAAPTSPAVSDNSQSYLNLILEYEYIDDGRHPVGLFVGDSITEGAALYDTQKWPNLVSGLTGSPTINMGCSGITTGYLTSPTAPLWTRFDLANYSIDFAYILLGTNDSNTSNNVSLATYQANLLTIINNLKALGIRRFVLGVIPPKGGLTAGSAEDALRASYRSWVVTSPMAAWGIADFDTVLRDIANPLQMRSDWAQADTLHPSAAGAQRMAREAASLHVSQINRSLS